MEINATPFNDQSVNTTGCCPRFNEAGWDEQRLHFNDKTFVRASTRSVAHVPLNMGKVFARVRGHIDAAHAVDPEHRLVLSRDMSGVTGEHLFAVTAAVPDEEMMTLTGDFLTKVFSGPFPTCRTGTNKCKPLPVKKATRPKPFGSTSPLARTAPRHMARTRWLDWSNWVRPSETKRPPGVGRPFPIRQVSSVRLQTTGAAGGPASLSDRPARSSPARCPNPPEYGRRERTRFLLHAPRSARATGRPNKAD